MEKRDDVLKALVTIRDYARWSVSRFTQARVCYGHGTDNAWDEALALIFHGLGLPHELSNEVLDSRLTMRERQTIVTLVETRVHDRLPVPYITGDAWFAGMPFKVDERVLIPRSPIAELIENQFQPWAQHPIETVLDLCTGSGCIGLACAAHLGADVDLADISADALEVARQNIGRHQLGEQAKLIQSDLLEQVSGSYDLIVSNPPYVDLNDFNSMPAEYQHEPAMALASGNDGLDCARQILAQAASYLNDNGLLVLEVGNSFVALEQAFPDVPFTWLEFQRGGHGVCVLGKEELRQYFS